MNVLECAARASVLADELMRAAVDENWSLVEVKAWDLEDVACAARKASVEEQREQTIAADASRGLRDATEGRR